MSDFKIDKFGGEFREVGGKETFALWVPMTAAEKETIVNKAKAEKVDVAALAGNCLREWLKVKELSAADLEKVAGGAALGGGMNPAGILNFGKLQQQSLLAKLKGTGGAHMSTNMCPW